MTVYAELGLANNIVDVVSGTTPSPLTDQAMIDINSSIFGHHVFDYVPGGDVTLNAARYAAAMLPRRKARVKAIELNRIERIMGRADVLYFIFDVLSDLASNANHLQGREAAAVKMTSLANITAIRLYAESLQAQLDAGAAVDIESGWPAS